MGLHEYRRGQFAKHIEEIYQEDYLPKIIKGITKGTKFLSELSMDELSFVAERMSVNLANEKIKELVFSAFEGKNPFPTPEEEQAMTEGYKQGILKGGNKKFLEILKKEFE